MADDITTDVGDGAKNINAGKGNAQDITENNADNNVTNNIFMPDWTKQRQADARPGELMADAAQELWKSIAGLNNLLGELKSAVDANSRATDKQATSIDQLSRAGDKQANSIDQLIKGGDNQVAQLARIATSLRSMGIQIPEANGTSLLVRRPAWWKEWLQPALITIGFAIIIFYLATGGHFP